MPARLKIGAVAVLVAAGGFYWFFFFVKHDPGLAPLAPFGDDPYDASGSFCMIASVLLGILSAVRAVRKYRPAAAKVARMYLARTQGAVATGILVTLYIDAIAMARHPAYWLGKPGSGELLGLISAMAAVAVAVLVLVAAGRPEAETTRPNPRTALLSLLIAGMVMAVFPESVIRFVTWHFLAILIGFAMVAWPQAQLACMVGPRLEAEPLPLRRPWVPWVLIVLFGTGIGGSVLAVELSEGGAGSLLHRVVVATVFLGAGAGTMVIGYAFPVRPLGLFRRLELQGAECAEKLG